MTMSQAAGKTPATLGKYEAKNTKYHKTSYFSFKTQGGFSCNQKYYFCLIHPITQEFLITLLLVTIFLMLKMY